MSQNADTPLSLSWDNDAFKRATGTDSHGTTTHAELFNAITRGASDLEEQATGPERPASPFSERIVPVRGWNAQRPLESRQAAPMVPFPRMWTTQRGRYTKVNMRLLPGMALLRARPSF